MDTRQLRELLGQQRFFAGLDAGDQHKLAEIAEVAEFPAGVEIFSEGAESRCLYFLLSGRVELCMSVAPHGCLPILTLGEGDLLGWSSALDQGEMTAAAAAVTDTRAITLPTDKLRDLCNEDHDIGYEIMRRVALALARRLVATRLQVLDLFAHEAPKKVPGAQAERDA